MNLTTIPWTTLGAVLFGLGLASGLFLWARHRSRRAQAPREALVPTPPLGGELQALYFNLEEALPEFRILAQVSLDRVLTPRGDRRQVQAARQQLLGHTVDFVICDRDFALVAIAEVEDIVLGDPGIDERARLIRRAGIPLLSWNTAKPPSVELIRERVQEIITLRQIEPLHLTQDEPDPALEAVCLGGDDEDEPQARRREPSF